MPAPTVPHNIDPLFTKRHALRIFLATFFFTTLLSGAIISILQYWHYQNEFSLLKSKENMAVDLGRKLMDQEFELIVADLKLLAASPALQAFLDQPTADHRVFAEQIFFNTVKINGIYDQARYLDHQGHEIIRVNLDNGQPHLVPSALLQDKSQRYYFTDTINLNPEQVFVSPFDLNIEHGEVQRPLKPMIRFGVPVFDSNGDKQGIVLLNYLGGILLERICQTMALEKPEKLKRDLSMSWQQDIHGKPLLLNRDGFYLLGPRPEQEWGFMLGHPYNFPYTFPREWQQILSEKKTQFQTENGLFTCMTIRPVKDAAPGSSTLNLYPALQNTQLITATDYHWRLLSYIDTGQINQLIGNFQKAGIIIFCIVQVIILPFIWFFSLARAKQKFAEKSLQAALTRESKEKAKTEAIIAAIGDGISIQNVKYEILYQNQRHQQMIGSHLGELCYQAYENVNKICENCPMAKAFADGKVHTGHRTIMRKGTVFEFEITVSPLFDNNGQITAGIEVVRDISRRKHVEEELVKIQKLESIGILAGGIAHDFNNLLTAIIGFISLAKKHLSADSDAFKLLSESENATSRAQHLTQRILTFSRGGEPKKKLTYITNLLKDAVKLALSGTRHKCEFAIADNLYPVEIDEGQLIQSLNNIITNAKDAMPDGGLIEVSADNLSISPGLESKKVLLPAGEYVRIKIKDHGCGISKEDLSKIFDPYFSSKGRGAKKGLGLGLTTAFSIIKKHGGDIKVFSEENKGAVFTIYLPVTQKMLPESQKKSAFPVSKRGRVLVMDDEEIVRSVIAQMLGYLDFECQGAETGEEAIYCYQRAIEEKNPFGAVILDLTIRGGLGGVETLTHLKKIDPNIKAIVASGYIDSPVMANYRDYGFSAAIPKPYNVETLGSLLNDIL